MFPILVGYRAEEQIRAIRQHGCCEIVIALPWAMMEPHEKQAQRNHSQSLRRLAERGGLGWCEAVAVLEDRDWHRMTHGEANARLVDLLNAYRAKKSLQARVAEWGVAAFGEQMAVETSLSVKAERNHRFLEEALELVQSAGCSKTEALQLVDYVFARPIGEIEQEVGGVMMCLALLCHKNDVDMGAAAEKELSHIWGKIDAIRAKRAAKPEFGPLPGFAAGAETETDANG